MTCAILPLLRFCFLEKCEQVLFVLVRSFNVGRGMKEDDGFCISDV
jgi:hypothetical protein